MSIITAPSILPLRLIVITLDVGQSSSIYAPGVELTIHRLEPSREVEQGALRRSVGAQSGAEGASRVKHGEPSCLMLT